MGDAAKCACFHRLRDIMASGGPDRSALMDLTAILRCTQRPDCPHRHECSDGVRELIEQTLRN